MKENQIRSAPGIPMLLVLLAANGVAIWLMAVSFNTHSWPT